MNKLLLAIFISTLSLNSFADKGKRDNQNEEQYEKQYKKGHPGHPHGMPPGQRMKQERAENNQEYFITEKNKKQQPPTVGQAVGGVVDVLLNSK